jgi:hypothetical protein
VEFKASCHSLKSCVIPTTTPRGHELCCVHKTVPAMHHMITWSLNPRTNSKIVVPRLLSKTRLPNAEHFLPPREARTQRLLHSTAIDINVPESKWQPQSRLQVKFLLIQAYRSASLEDGVTTKRVFTAAATTSKCSISNSDA